MAFANTICSIYSPFMNEENHKTTSKWEIIQTIGSWTNQAAGNADIISDVSSGAYEIRLMQLHVSIVGDVNSSASILCTAAKDTFGAIDKGTTTSGQTGNWNFGPIGLLVDNTSTTAVVALVNTVTYSGYFYCQIARRAV